MEEKEVEKLGISKKDKTKIFYKKHKSKFNFALMLVVCLLLAKIVTTFVFTSSLVIGHSMEETLSNGDKGVSDALFFKIGKLKRFDILTIERGDSLLVKRLIGLPGETINYSDGVLKINDVVVEEKFLTSHFAMQTGNIDIILHDDEYYVLGDNRIGNNSLDSRSFGPIEYKKIKGRGLLIFAKCKIADETQGCKGLKFVWPYFA